MASPTKRHRSRKLQFQTLSSRLTFAADTLAFDSLFGQEPGAPQYAEYGGPVVSNQVDFQARNDQMTPINRYYSFSRGDNWATGSSESPLADPNGGYAFEKTLGYAPLLARAGTHPVYSGEVTYHLPSGDKVNRYLTTSMPFVGSKDGATWTARNEGKPVLWLYASYAADRVPVYSFWDGAHWNTFVSNSSNGEGVPGAVQVELLGYAARESQGSGVFITNTPGVAQKETGAGTCIPADSATSQSLTSGDVASENPSAIKPLPGTAATSPQARPATRGSSVQRPLPTQATGNARQTTTNTNSAPVAGTVLQPVSNQVIVSPEQRQPTSDSLSGANTRASNVPITVPNGRIVSASFVDSGDRRIWVAQVQTSGATGNQMRIYASVVNRNTGAVVRPNILLSSNSVFGNHQNPVAKVARNGHVVVAWQYKGLGNAHGIYFATIKPAAATVNVAMTSANASASNQQTLTQPGIAINSDGTFSIHWVNQSKGNSRWAASFQQANGVKVRQDFRLGSG